MSGDNTIKLRLVSTLAPPTTSGRRRRGGCNRASIKFSAVGGQHTMLPDNMKRCSTCGRPVPKEPTRSERELHLLNEELEDAVMLKNVWATRWHRWRGRDAVRAMEAQAEMQEFANEVARLVYYIGLLEAVVDNERRNKQ